METLVDKIIELQSRANKQIDTYGEIADVLGEELERLYDMLTPEQEDELISRYKEVDTGVGF